VQEEDQDNEQQPHGEKEHHVNRKSDQAPEHQAGLMSLARIYPEAGGGCHLARRNRL
jgi:hypothetical protein